MRSASSMAAIAILGTAVLARAEVTSGPQVGDRVGAFQVTKVAGNPDDGWSAGQQGCYRCKTGFKPVVMVFARTADDRLAKLLKKVDEEVAEHEDVKMTSFVNMIGSDMESLKKAAVDFCAEHDFKKITFVVPDDVENGPSNFAIDPEADVTVICYREGKVRANHAFPKDGLTDEQIDAVVAASCALVE